jgi:hypothetical protein
MKTLLLILSLSLLSLYSLSQKQEKTIRFDGGNFKQKSVSVYVNDTLVKKEKIKRLEKNRSNEPYVTIQTNASDKLRILVETTELPIAQNKPLIVITYRKEDNRYFVDYNQYYSVEDEHRKMIRFDGGNFKQKRVSVYVNDTLVKKEKIKQLEKNGYNQSYLTIRTNSISDKLRIIIDTTELHLTENKLVTVITCKKEENAYFVDYDDSPIFDGTYKKTIRFGRKGFKGRRVSVYVNDTLIKKGKIKRLEKNDFNEPYIIVRANGTTDKLRIIIDTTELQLTENKPVMDIFYHKETNTYSVSYRDTGFRLRCGWNNSFMRASLRRIKKMRKKHILGHTQFLGSKQLMWAIHEVRGAFGESRNLVAIHFGEILN